MLPATKEALLSKNFLLSIQFSSVQPWGCLVSSISSFQDNWVLKGTARQKWQGISGNMSCRQNFALCTIYCGICQEKIQYVVIFLESRERKDEGKARTKGFLSGKKNIRTSVIED